MAQTNFTPILLYASSTVAAVPSAGNLTNSAIGSEIAINIADKNLFFKDSGGVVNTVPIRQSGTSSNGWLSATDWNTFNGKAPATSGTSILYGNGSGGFSNVTIGTGITFAGGTLSATGTGGTVTSVTGTSPVVSSGGTTPAISLATAYGDTLNPYASKTANYILAAPNGSAGVPTFRAIVAADVPALAYVTSVSGTGSVNGITLTGTVTSSGSLTLGGTLSGIGNSQLTNSTISGVALGGSLFNLTAGTGVSFSAGTTYNGSAAITINATGTGGTVTSVAALTLGTTGTDLSSTVANSTTTPVITLNVPTASSTNRGALSSTDWSTFNGKQAALVSGTNIKTVSGTSLLGSGDVGTIGVGYGGTGTATTFVAGSVVFAGASGVYTQDNGQLFYDDTNNRLGVGTSTPAQKLDVNGVGRFGSLTTKINVGLNGDSISSDGDMYVQTSASKFISIRANFTEGIRVHPSGGVSVASTTDPGATNLSVAGLVGVGVVPSSFKFQVQGADTKFNATSGSFAHYIETASTSGGNTASLRLKANTYNYGWYVSDSLNGIVLYDYTASAERLRVDSSSNLLVGTTATTGSTSNNAMVVGGIHKTISGSVSATSGSATTLYTAPTLSNGTYIISAGIANTGEPAYYSSVSLISVDSTVLAATVLKAGLGMVISVSGQNVQATQSSGITTTIVWTAIRIH